MNNLSWSFSNIWNQSLEQGKPERLLEPRQHIWASEMGGAYLDRYLKMKGIPLTNPPNPRSMRKFEAGNMMEWLVMIVLKRAGILIDVQQWIAYQYPELLKVTGKLDCFAGGKPDWSKSLKEIHQLGLPEFFGRATNAIIAYFQKEYPAGLKEIVLEVKSCSNFMFERYEKYGLDAAKNHAMQTFHYLKSKGLPEAHIVYICKDDLRMLEIGVMNPSPVEDMYKSDIEIMTGYINSDIQPEKEKEIIFNEDTCKFSQNWKVGYSGYLKHLYGYENQMQYEEKYKKTISKWNRTLGRCSENKQMTHLNIATIKEIKKVFSDFDQIVEKAKQSGIKEDVEESVNESLC